MTPSPDVRYPVGRFDFKDPFRSEDRPLFLAQLAAAPANLRVAVTGLSDSRLDTPYRPGGWTVRQVVHHLADAHVNWYIRPKLAPRDWLRKFTNPEWGTLTVEDTLRAMVWHARHHTAHITELRKRIGW